MDKNLVSLNAQILKEIYQRIMRILDIHCGGYLIMFYEKLDELYIKLKKDFERIIHSEGFEPLLEKYKNFLPPSLHGAGFEVDVEWDFLEQEVVIYNGDILEFCIENKAGYTSIEIQEQFQKNWKFIDEIIMKTNRDKKKTEDLWLRKSTDSIQNNLNDEVNEILYISNTTIENLKTLKPKNFDLTKLIRLCEEINICYVNCCYFSVAILVRALLDHIPPLFGFSNFNQFLNNYRGGGKSFKDLMNHLESSQRKIADSFLHNQIRDKEVLPTKNAINFSSDVETLLIEILRFLK